MADRTAGSLAALIVAALVLVGGCTPVASPTPAVALADRLNAALAEGSQSFRAQFASADLGASWFAVLTEGQGRFAAAADSAGVSVTTQFAGDPRAATETLTLDLDPRGRIVSASGLRRTPLWVAVPVVIETAGTGTMMSAGLTPHQRGLWVKRVAGAADTVARSGLVDAVAGLVVELPADAASFTAASGASAADTAAVTECESGASRIVINPALDARGTSPLQATLVHEAVHAATESACHHGTAWVVEGSAEAVAAGADPATAKANRSLVQAYLKAHPVVPDAPPAAPSTPTDYALAAVAVEALRAHRGADANAIIRRGIVNGLNQDEQAEATRWYADALARLG